MRNRMYSRLLHKIIISEALPLRTAIDLSKGWNKDRHADWFGGKYRVYIPLVSKINSDLLKSDIEKEIENSLSNTDYELVNYHKGIVKSKKYNREEKLGKILNKLNLKNLLSKFESDKTRTGSSISSQQPIVVISRHPYDIAGMSTDRGWTSCKNLGTGKIYGKNENVIGLHSKYVEDEVHSLLIAYLINPNDKNIKNPIARVLLVPYMNNKMDIAYVVNNKIYGSSGSISKSFIDTVKQWLDQKQGVKTGSYKINPFVYSDDMKSIIDFSKNIKLPDWVIKSGNKPKEFEYRNNNVFVWINGTWEYGTWEDGAWYNGIWEYGIWKKGNWMNGRWKDGVWKDGVWKNGVWEDGTWVNGIWDNGTWEDGTWVNGTWKNGTWKNGIWDNGYIWTQKFQVLIYSKVNPREFYKLEKDSKNLEELKNKSMDIKK